MTLRRLLLAALALLLVLHQDVWNGQELRWLAGLPAGLLYHIIYCLAVALLFWALLRIDRRLDD